MEKLQEEIESKQWHGRFLCAWWQDEDLSMDECFAWLQEWPSAPIHTITGYWSFMNSSHLLECMQKSKQELHKESTSTQRVGCVEVLQKLLHTF